MAAAFLELLRSATPVLHLVISSHPRLWIQKVPLEVGGKEFSEDCSPQVKKRVSFGELELRKFPVILGDHPECYMGPPVSAVIIYHSGRVCGIVVL